MYNRPSMDCGHVDNDQEEDVVYDQGGQIRLAGSLLRHSTGNAYHSLWIITRAGFMNWNNSILDSNEMFY